MGTKILGGTINAFKLFCFCLLKNYIDDNTIIDTNYLLDNGYDNYLNQGLIKLYEIIYDRVIELTKLKLIKNIPNLSFIKEPINCIIQSSKNGKIIVKSWDRTINLVSKQNLECCN